MFSSLGFLLLIWLRFAYSGTSTRCFRLQEETSLCFVKPATPLTLSWSNAQQWCKNIGGTLPILTSETLRIIYGNAAGLFGLGDQTLWLGGNSTLDFNTWKWIDGSTYDGEIENTDNSNRTHAVIERLGNTVNIEAASPFEWNYALIQFRDQNGEISCNRQWHSLWIDGKCYAKFQNWPTSWNNIRRYNYDLAIVEDGSQMSTWLENGTKYWIGLSCSWWNWHDSVSGTSYPFIETAFDWNLPNNTSPQCLASLSDNYNSWINLECSSKLRFICQLPENTTTSTTITTTTSTETTMTTATSTGTSATSLKPETSTVDSNFMKGDTGMAIVLGLGLGLGVLLIILMWLFTVTVFVIKIIRALRKIKVNEYPNGERVMHSHC